MDINPMMLLSMLMGNKESGDGKSPDIQKLMGMLTSFQSGNPDALLEMLGGNNEQLKTIMSVMKNAQPSGTENETSNQKENNNPFRSSPESFRNDEITRALNILMSSKFDKK